MDLYVIIRRNGWATPKDLILHLAGKLTVRVSDPQFLVTNCLSLIVSSGWNRANSGILWTGSVQSVLHR